MAIDYSVPLVAAGLAGGYAAARYSGRRELGGVVLAAAGLAAGRSWWTRGPAVTAGLSAVYLGAFGLSHPLAKYVGPWSAVAVATAAATSTTAGVLTSVDGRK